MNKLNITRTTGDIARPKRNEDHVSGLIINLPTGCSPQCTADIQRISTLDTLKAWTGLDDWNERTSEGTLKKYPAQHLVHYHVSEFLRTSEGGTLYAMWVVGKTPEQLNETIVAMQRHAGGTIRQVAVVDCYNSRSELCGVPDNIPAHPQCEEEMGAPLSVIYEPAAPPTDSDEQSINQSWVELIDTGVLSQEYYWISIVLGADCSDKANALRRDLGKSDSATTAVGLLGSAGAVLGLVSRASVHESISWAKKFPLGYTVPGFITGEKLTNISQETIADLDERRYIFPVTYAGISGCYLNASHTLTPDTHDFAYIENVRTMDKAVRGIRAALIPELGGNIYVDTATGQLAAHSVAHLETIASHPLEEMEKAGELSGYRVEIDPEQNVLATGTLDIKVRKVDVGVMRTINIAIGNVTAL